MGPVPPENGQERNPATNAHALSKDMIPTAARSFILEPTDSGSERGLVHISLPPRPTLPQ